MIATALCLLLALPGASISGVVQTPGGDPAPGVSVFAEPGLGGPLLQQKSDANGLFRFPEIPSGQVGVFIAEQGHPFTGKHVTLAVGQDLAGLTLKLAEAGTVEGVVKSAEGEPLKGAQITRVALTGADKVGIPLAKLSALGFPMPISDAEGRFKVSHLPRGQVVALKAGHPGYAQEGVADVRVGAGDVTITMYRGVVIEGSVAASASGPVSGLSVLFRNAQPPHDTAVAETGVTGGFSIRLKPGVYAYSVMGGGARSAGWQQFRVTGEQERQHLRIGVAAAGKVSGVFRDAVTGAPIPGVRVSLFANGARAEVQQTGPAGAYAFVTSEGPNAVHFESAPGYLPPPTPQVPFAAVAGQEVVLPEMWLAPMPRLQLSVVNAEGAPVPGALVQLLRPAQFGWQSADTNGRINLLLSSYPSGQRVLGYVESPAGQPRQAAVFALDPREPEASSVQLYPAATLTGRATDSAGKALAGVEVGGLFPGESEAESPLLLWQCRTDAEGRFSWPGIVAGVPQQIIAQDAAGHSALGTAVNLAPGEAKDTGDIVIPDGRGGTALSGTRWDAAGLTALCGDAPDWRALRKKSLLVLFAPAANVPAAVEALDGAASTLRALEIIPIVVTDAAAPCSGLPVTVVKSSAKLEPRTLLVTPGGDVTLETSGLPPVSVLTAHARSAR